MGFNIGFTEIFIIIASYLLGSIPFGLIIGSFAGIGDIRKKGSGNIGATNMTRVGGKKLGAITLLLDGIKGIAAVMLAKFLLSGQDSMLQIAALAAAASVIGHIFPVWLKFRGGKGVITTMSTYLALYWPLGLACIAIWFITFFATRISSLSAIFAMIAAPSIAFYFADKIGNFTVYLSFFLSILVVARHYTNILRLISGEENKVL